MRITIDLRKLCCNVPVRPPFPLLHLKHTKKLDLSGFDFDDMLR